MPDQTLLKEILEQVKEAGKQSEANAKCLAVLHDRLKHHMEVEHKEFDVLINVIREGKGAAKALSILVAALAAIASFAAWVYDHLPRFN